MKRFCECHHPDCNICKICNKYEQRITELETANKGLQITLLDESEKEKELQLRNAMLVNAIKNRGHDCPYTDPCGEPIRCRVCDAIDAASAQSAAWLENSHREWINSLPKAGYAVEADIDSMVNRFLGWKLPKNFNPDGGISFARTENTYIEGRFVKDVPRSIQSWPIGTNLLDAGQAREMIEYMLAIPKGD